MTEFDLIRRYFTRATPGTLLGIGDDAALIQVSQGNVLAVSSDMLVSGTHFFPDADPQLLGHKTLAVNLSDMAAMGAKPKWVTLAIALHDPDDAWLSEFSSGFFGLAQQHGVELVGGDTTRGPLNLSVTVFGEVPAHQAMRRSGAAPDDEIWVSGVLGDAALALAHLQGEIELGTDEYALCSPALHQPQPRVELGLALRDIASSAIDISDGLLGDLAHILEASGVGAEIDFSQLPASTLLQSRLNMSLGRRCVLAGGDDYELCFTAPSARRNEISAIAARMQLPLTVIGKIVAGQGCIVRDVVGGKIELGTGGYDHFR